MIFMNLVDACILQTHCIIVSLYEPGLLLSLGLRAVDTTPEVCICGISNEVSAALRCSFCLIN